MVPTKDVSSFDRDDYLAVLKNLAATHQEAPLLIANFDWGTKHQPYDEQIREAKELFQEFPFWSTNFILKPCKDSSSVVRPEEVAPFVSELGSFDVIERLRRICSLRRTLTNYSVYKPIHVWGGLDPMITPLYYFAGADIFDGVSWLRYFFHNGMATTRDSFPLHSEDIGIGSDASTYSAYMANISELRRLADALKLTRMSKMQDFSGFRGNADTFSSAYTFMLAKIPELKEVWNGE